MGKPFSHILGFENVADDAATLDAYSFSSGELEQKPDLVLWPQTTEQVARVLRETNQSRAHVIIRGAGTSTGNATTGSNAFILSSERMHGVLRIDMTNRFIEIQSGARISEINDLLSETELVLPFHTIKGTETVGGLLAVNAFARESEQLGPFRNLVLDVEFVDGTGKIFQVRDLSNLAGKEGLSGFITKAKIKLIPRQTLSLDIFQFYEPTDLLKKINSLKQDVERYFVEYIDKKISKKIGLDEKLTLVVAYTTTKGRHGTLADANELIKKVDGIHKMVIENGAYFILDPKVPFEKAYDLITWCERKEVPLRGHAGSGVFFAYFCKADKQKIDEFRGFLKSISGRLGCCFGSGTLNADFVTSDERKQLIKLKDEYDYNNTLNPGKLIQYR